MDRIDQLLESYQDEMVQILRELVRIPSVDGEPKEGMPFGENCAKVLDYALKKAESFGFETLNDENYAGHVAFGGGSGRTLGILAHLDVVPEGEDWTVPPYEAIVKGQNVPESGVPESFKVLVKELQSLGLDIKVLDEDKNEIDLKQNFDDDDDMGVIDTDSEAFSTVANESEFTGFGVGEMDESGEIVEEEIPAVDDYDEDTFNEDDGFKSSDLFDDFDDLDDLDADTDDGDDK